MTGRTVKLSLDLGLQRFAQGAYQRIAGAQPGAFVALDPRNGEIMAMGSFPTFDPSALQAHLTSATTQMFGAQAGSPAVQPGHRRLSDRLDVQADHGARVAQRRHHAPSRIIDDHACITVGTARRAAMPATSPSGRSTSHRP